MMEILTKLDEQCARQRVRRERGREGGGEGGRREEEGGGGGREEEGGGKEGNVGTGKKARVL